MPGRIVVVDDSEIVCTLLQMHLQQAGYETQSFQDPRKVIQTFFVDQTPLPDLVIVDLILPKIDGYRLIKRFRQYSKSLPIIVLTRRNGKRDRMAARLAGANDFVTKPFQVQDMLTLVDQLLRRKPMFEPNTMLLQQYTATYPQSRETLVDFGMVPQDAEDREDWQAERDRFIAVLSRHDYQFWAAMFDEASGLSPLYLVRLDRRDFQGPTPADLSYLQWVIQQNRLCHPGQTTRIVEQVLEIHILGDGQSLDELFRPKG